MMYDSTYMSYIIIEYSNLYKQKVEWWLPGAGRRREWGVINGYRVSVLQDERVLEIDCTTL